MKTQLRDVAEECRRFRSQCCPSAALEKVVELNGFEVPDGMIEDQLRALMEEIKMQRAYQGEDPQHPVLYC